MNRSPMPRSTNPMKRTRINPKRSTPRRTTVHRDRGYLAEVALNYCTVGMKHGSEIGCSMVTDAAHGPVNGMGSKGADSGAIPLCRTHHREQHRIGWPAFEAKYGFSREKEAAAHYAAYLIETGKVEGNA